MSQPLKPGIDYIGVSTAFYCHDGNGNFLLHKRSKNCRDEQGSWDNGGGRLEFGLTPEENVLKELEEEYGCKGEIQEKLPAHSIFREFYSIKTHWIQIPFIIKIDPKEAKNNEPDKIDEMGWFRLDNLPQPYHKGSSQTLREYKDYFDKYR